jgi:TonB family protein
MAKNGKKLHIVLEVNLDGERARQDFEQDKVIVGSGPVADLKLEHPSVSSMHGIFQAGQDAEGALLVVLEEGVKLNGEEVERQVKVRRGDTLVFGEVEVFVVGCGEDAVETKMEKAPARPPTPPPPRKEAADRPKAGPDEADDEGEELQAEPTRPDGKSEPRKPEARPPEVKKAEIKRPPAPPPRKDSGTQVVRRREIPTQAEAGFRSGENFFARELTATERPHQGDRLLEVKVMWGRIVLDVRQFRDGETVTVGDSPQARIQLASERDSSELLTLASPGGAEGYVLHVASGMELEVRRAGRAVEVGELPSQGATRTYPLRLDERARVMMGQLAFVIQYVSGARAVRSSAMMARDIQLGKWWTMLFVVAVGVWFMIDTTPPIELDAFDYLKNPARFATLLMPTKIDDKKKSFEEIKKQKEEKPKAEDDDKWKKVQSQTKKPDKDIPKEVKREQDRKIATNAGILGLLKKAGGGTGDDASSVFGGSAMTNLDSQLEAMRSGMGDSGGFGGLGIRGGGPGGGGGGLGLGGMGTAGYGRGAGAGYGSASLGHRGKSNVTVVQGKTRIIGGLSQKVVGDYIKRYWAQFKFCYERELSKNPNLYGKVSITFTIDGSGRVSEASVIQSTMHNANVEECLLRVIRRIRFPQPKGGGEVIVTYPFLFQTAG